MDEVKISKVLQDSLINDEFNNDVINYAKLLVVTSCPKDRVEELKEIINQNDIKSFVKFANNVLPEFNKKLVEYLRYYGYLQP